MDPFLTAAITLLFILYLLDANVFTALGLLLSQIPVSIQRRCFSLTIRIRLWIDRQALIHRGPLGRLWNEYCLWRIRTNPAYREFFQDRE